MYGISLVYLMLTLQSIQALQPNGSHVCGRQCHKLEWKSKVVTRMCGYPKFTNTCHITVRRPEVSSTTCYECCEGWRQSDDMNCDKGCLSGSAGVLDCADLPEGWYQLCDSCAEYAQCKDNRLSRHYCPGKWKWDDLRKKCVKHSQTCHIEGSEDDIPSTSSRDEITSRDQVNELTNEIGSFDGGVDAGECGEETCRAPARCIMMFKNDMYRLQPKCICPAGMRLSKADGRTCQVINECTERSPCMHGRCVERRYGYSCRCEADWRGRHCNKQRRQTRDRQGSNSNRQRSNRHRERGVRVEVHRDVDRENGQHSFDNDVEWDFAP